MRKIHIKLKNRIASNIALIILIGSLGMGSCTYYTNDFEKVEAPDSISFELNIIPIFESGCAIAGCHSGTIPPDFQSDVAYNNLIFGGYVTDTTAAENNILYKKINGGSMTGFASDKDRVFIKQWIEDGAKNN